MQLIAFRDIPIRVGCSQDHDRNRFQAGIVLDESQNLAAIHSRHIQIQQGKIRARDVDENSLMPEKGQRLNAVICHVQTDSWVHGVEGFLRQPDISATVFDQENF
jgi:hypothetical protein